MGILIEATNHSYCCKLLNFTGIFLGKRNIFDTLGDILEFLRDFIRCRALCIARRIPDIRISATSNGIICNFSHLIHCFDKIVGSQSARHRKRSEHWSVRTCFRTVRSLILKFDPFAPSLALSCRICWITSCRGALQEVHFRINLIRHVEVCAIDRNLDSVSIRRTAYRGHGFSRMTFRDNRVGIRYTHTIVIEILIRRNVRIAAEQTSVGECSGILERFCTIARKTRIANTQNTAIRRLHRRRSQHDAERFLHVLVSVGVGHRRLNINRRCWHRVTDITVCVDCRKRSGGRQAERHAGSNNTSREFTTPALSSLFLPFHTTPFPRGFTPCSKQCRKLLSEGASSNSNF